MKTASIVALCSSVLISFILIGGAIAARFINDVACFCIGVVLILFAALFFVGALIPHH